MSQTLRRTTEAHFLPARRPPALGTRHLTHPPRNRLSSWGTINRYGRAPAGLLPLISSRRMPGGTHPIQMLRLPTLSSRQTPRRSAHLLRPLRLAPAGSSSTMAGRPHSLHLPYTSSSLQLRRDTPAMIRAALSSNPMLRKHTRVMSSLAGSMSSPAGSMSSPILQQRPTTRGLPAGSPRPSSLAQALRLRPAGSIRGSMFLRVRQHLATRLPPGAPKLQPRYRLHAPNLLTACHQSRRLS